MATESQPLRKVCFVTVGATAEFDGLIRAILSQAFLQSLIEAHYTDLLVQYGTAKATFEACLQEIVSTDAGLEGIKVLGFDFNPKGLGQEMRQVKAGASKAEGVVISHAGAGCILDALRVAVPLVVVPNPELLDNHQLELAEALASQGYVVHGDLRDLPSAIRKTEKLRGLRKGWAPVNSGEDHSRKGIQGVMDYEMGFID